MVDFWLDPSCPYTWVTSRWLLEVATVRPITPRWRVMSLSVLNEGHDDDPEGDPEGHLWVPVRICAAVQQEYGYAAVGRLHTAMWDPRRRTGDWIGDLHGALEDAGLPSTLADVGTTTDFDAAVRASHAEGVSLLGPHVGSPIVAAPDDRGQRVAFFGPVFSRIPAGEQAGRVWDGCLLVAAAPGFHELKGPPHEAPDLDGRH